MPFIVSRVNQRVSQDQQEKLREGLVEKIEQTLGKPRDYIMLDLQEGSPLYVRGKDEPAAYIEANIYGANPAGFAKLSQEITKMYEDILGIPANNVFINFQDIPGFSINGNYM